MICKDNISGIKSLFLIPFIELPRRFFIDGSVETVVQPKIEPIYLLNASVSFNFSDDFYTQTLNFKTPNLINSSLITDFEKKEYRAVVTDNNKNSYLIGKDNGITLRTNNGTTGNNKIDFSGYDLTFEGKEKEIPLKLENISQFIEGVVLFLSSSEELTSSSKKTSDIYI